MPINLPQTFLDEEDVPIYFQQLDNVEKRCANAMLHSPKAYSGSSLVSRYFGSAMRTAAVTAPQTMLKAIKGAVGSSSPLTEALMDFAFLNAQNSHDFAWNDATRSVLEGFTRHPDLLSLLMSCDVISSSVQLANEHVFSRLSGSGLTWAVEAAINLRTGAERFWEELQRVLKQRKE